jgi:hypothetical protein
MSLETATSLQCHEENYLAPVLNFQICHEISQIMSDGGYFVKMSSVEYNMTQLMML